MSRTLILILAGTILPSMTYAEIPVRVQDLGDVLVAREYRAPASVIPANRTVVTSQVTALIDEVAADVGQTVEKGQLLVTLDPADARIALAEAEAAIAALDARLQDARQRLRRAENLLAKDFVSEDELSVRETEVAVIEANRTQQLVAVRNARLNLARTEVSAPFDAVVVERQAQVGNLATPGSPLMTLVETADREVDAEIDPRLAVQLEVGAGARFVSDGQEWPLELVRLTSVIETDTRKVRGRFRFPHEVAPIGAAGDVAWSEPSGLIPVTLIVQRDDSLGIFTITDGRASFVPIPSAQEGRPARVDLPVDTPIVTSGHVRLQDGDAVQIARE